MNSKEKSLRWVVNQIPDFDPKSNEEKMLLNIKRYCQAGAGEIKRLEAENEELKLRKDEILEKSLHFFREYDRSNRKIEALQAENAELKARLSNAVELPAKVMIERTLVDGKFKPTQKAQAFNGRIGVVYRDETRWKGLLVDICSEKTGDYESAEARLAELKGENDDKSAKKDN